MKRPQTHPSEQARWLSQTDGSISLGDEADAPEPTPVPAGLAEEVAALVVRQLSLMPPPEPPLVDLAYLAWRSQASERTIRRWIEDAEIPARNLSGQLWREGDGPKRYLLSEFLERKAAKPQRISAETRRRRRAEQLLEKSHEISRERLNR